MSDAFFTLHHGLPRQSAGSDATTSRLLELAGPLPPRPRILDLGCGPGRAALLLAAETGGHVTAVDLHHPFLDELQEAASRRTFDGGIETVHGDMGELPYPDGSFDLIWAEGSAYIIGFDTALRQWRRLLAPGGVLVVTECEWATDTPSPEARAFWSEYPMLTTPGNIAVAREAGYAVIAVHPQPDSDWFDEYYTPLAERLDVADTTDEAMAHAVAATRAEIAVRREHGADYRYTGYVLRPSEDDRLRERLAVPGSERAARYPAHWLTAGAMGPNPLWLTETLADAMAIEPGMRVLDLGCGKAITSAFLAREYGARVWAADLWIDPADNWQRIRAAGVADSVVPVKAEAHALPFAEGFFDAIVCVDAYEYFGTDERYIAYLSRFVKPGGRIGVSVPATVTELDGEVPEHLRETWDWEFHSWHTPQWWQRMWARTGHVEVERADLLPDACAHWQRWEQTLVASGSPEGSGTVARMLADDAGRTFGFARLVAHRPAAEETVRPAPTPAPPGLAGRLALPRYPRSAGYDPQWLIDDVMGPNPLWLMEWLRPALDLQPGSRVLDLGCGTALTSVFLAKEYGLQVTAADLWIDPAYNWRRLAAAGCADTVSPLRAEAHDLPFADGYFDAIVSIDAYHYFGTDQRYLPYLARFLRPGGQIGIVAPAVAAEIDGNEPPEHLRPYVDPDFWTFHSPGWWQQLWSRSGAVEVETADLLDDGWRDWALWSEVCAQHSHDERVQRMAAREAEMVRQDAGRTLGFARVVGRRGRS